MNRDSLNIGDIFEIYYNKQRVKAMFIEFYEPYETENYFMKAYIPSFSYKIDGWNYETYKRQMRIVCYV